MEVAFNVLGCRVTTIRLTFLLPSFRTQQLVDLQSKTDRAPPMDHCEVGSLQMFYLSIVICDAHSARIYDRV
jgi:hypothetical protein